MTDYEKQFQANEAACGEPFPELSHFFAEQSGRALQVLDLGCGQGRDALLAASLGHVVHGVDIAPTGIRQMLDQASARDLPVTGEVADLRSFATDRTFDVVVLDRVIHMLKNPDDQKKLLRTAQEAVAAEGYVLIADTPANLPRIEAAFDDAGWILAMRKAGFRFYQRSARARAG